MSSTLKHFSISLLALSSMMPILSVKFMAVSTLSEILLLLSTFGIYLYSKKKGLIDDKLFFTYFIIIILSSFIIPHSDMKAFWRPSTLSFFVKYLLVILLYIVLYKIMTLRDVALYHKYFYFAVIINIFWSLAQYIFSIIGVDLNEVVFKELLHTSNMETVSVTVNDKMRSTGLSWHTATLAPLVVIGFFLSSNWLYRFGLFVLTGLSSSSTTAIGFFLCLFVFLLNNNENRKRSHCIIFGLFFLVTILLFSGFLISLLEDSYGRVYLRLSNIYEGDDSEPHFWYYLMLPEIWDNLSIVRRLFGFGIANSGYMYTLLWGRFSDMPSWTVESDIINIFLNSGLVGFSLYYLWLIRIMIRGYKINHQYSYIIGILLFLGIFYNVQYDSVLLFEMILSICIHRNVDFFSIKNIDTTRKIVSVQN